MHRPPFDICHQLGNYGQFTSSLRVSICPLAQRGVERVDGWITPKPCESLISFFVLDVMYLM